jgi:hypothetical protein
MNVSEGGCCFECGLRFPVHPDMLLELSWPRSSVTLSLPGRLVRRSNISEGYRYGMQFHLTSLQRAGLIGRLNELLFELCPDQTKIHALYRQLSLSWVSRRNRGTSS